MSNPLGNDGVGIIVDGDHRLSMTVNQYNEALARSAGIERAEAVHTDRDRIAAYVKTKLCWEAEDGRICTHESCSDLFDIIDAVWEKL